MSDRHDGGRDDPYYEPVNDDRQHALHAAGARQKRGCVYDSFQWMPCKTGRATAVNP